LVVEVLADQHGGIEVLKWRRTSQQVKSGARQCILVSPAVDSVVHQLLGRGKTCGSDNHLRAGQGVRVAEAPGDAEARQCNPSFPG
jgi:hypothetical protein